MYCHEGDETTEIYCQDFNQRPEEPLEELEDTLEERVHMLEIKAATRMTALEETTLVERVHELEIKVATFMTAVETVSATAPVEIGDAD